MVVVVALFVSRKAVIESISCSKYRAARVVSSFVVGDRNEHSEAQSKEHLRPCMDAASGTNGPEAAVFDRIIRSFNLCPTVVRLV